MLFSVLWLRTVLAAGFVPNKQHGIFVAEKRHMLVMFFLAHQLSGESQEIFSEVVQTNLDSNFIAKDKNWPEKCSQKALSKHMRNGRS